jgi:hypothetical protein
MTIKDTELLEFAIMLEKVEPATKLDIKIM